jgi:hypothetical protein
MTGLFGWVADAGSRPRDVLAAMGCALRAHPREAWATHEIDHFGIGVLDGVDAHRVREWATPAMSDDGQHALWLAGEIFDAGSDTPDRPQDAPSSVVRSAILRRLIARGPSAMASIDGEFQIAWLDRRTQTLHLIGDRFGGLAWYWARSAAGVAFACGVRGVLMAPGIGCEPDVDALRDAATYGGYRLGSTTNVAGVRMFPGAVAATIRDGRLSVRRWWRWTDLEQRSAVTLDEAIDGLDARWRQAIARRLRGAERPGEALSGGFDSRAILAEAAPRASRWTAITYGVPGCDDQRYARKAARRAGVQWFFHRLYDGDWLAARGSHIQQTDGLIQLADLLHCESLPLQRAHLDVHLSGYIGDAVAGPTANHVSTIEEALLQTPYYGVEISRPWNEALERLSAATEDPAWLPSRWALFEHKYPQSTNRWSASWRPWLRVRKPFTDYELFDFCQSLPAELRGRARFYERWLRRAYPALFAHIPAQKLNVPAAASAPRIVLARGLRVVRRQWMRTSAAIGVPHAPWSRAFHDEHGAWSAPPARDIIESTILRRDSIGCDLWGRQVVQRVVDDWFSSGHGPTQVIGALFTFEAYHRGLRSHLADAAAEARRLQERCDLRDGCA